MGDIPPVWTEQRSIGWLDVDVLGRLRPQTLYGYLLDAASNHALGTAYDYEPLAAKGLKWVMVKMQLVIWRQPRFGDRVTVETWAKRTDRLYLLRDFAVSSASGVRLVSATAVWLIMDEGRGRPHRWDAQANAWPWLPGRDELQTNLQKVPELQDGAQVDTFRVHFSDIDVNRHVNATRYLQWIVDSHSQAQLEATELAEVELSFLAEALPNDEVVIYSEQRDGRELCAVRRAGDGKELCRARLAWRTSG